MPIKKYKSFEAASRDLWVKKPDYKYYRNLRLLFEFWMKMNKTEIKKGVIRINGRWFS
jgi:hypothetical protein